MSRGEAKIINHTALDDVLVGAKEVYEAVSKVYGPTSSNVAIQKNYGYASITHDGISVAREVYLENEDQDIGAGLLVQASDKSNNVSGDGTSATIMLGYHNMRLARQRAAAGYGIMGLRRGIDRASIDIKAALDKVAIPVPDKDLAKVAAISASDPEVGKIVADTVIKVGGVGITVEGYDGLGVVQDVVEGIYFETGWQLPHFMTDPITEEAVHHNPNILVVEKKIKQNQDISPIIETIFENAEEKTLIIIGHVDGQAIETCALTNLKGGVKVCVIKPPVYGDQELPFLEDIATMTGGQVVTSSMPADKITMDFFGHADKITVAKDHTTIFNGKGIKEDIALRIDTLKEQLQSDKYNAFQKERMEFRLAKLQGKIGIIRVGGANESVQKEMKDRVDDAVHATRAAKEEGIVPGGATTLARLSQLPIPKGLSRDETEGYKVVLEALAEPFKQLMSNAGEDGGYLLRQVLDSPAGYGYNVTNITAKPIDLIKNGVLDPVKVIKSVVENACEVAGLAITIHTTITIDRAWQLDQISLNKAKQSQ